MTDQEYEKELAELLDAAPSDEKKHTKGRIRRVYKAVGSWSRRRKLITGAAAAAAACLYFPECPAQENRMEHLS